MPAMPSMPPSHRTLPWHPVPRLLLMQNNQLYYGSSGTSGELGHITVCKDGPLCACGNSGCLEAVASGEAIALQARDAVCSGLPTSLRERCGGASERIDAKLVFEAARGMR